MKWLSIILSIYILVLSVFPCCLDEQYHEETEVIAIAHFDGGDNTDSAGEGDWCSPFVSCHCCIGFILPSYFLTVSHTSVQKQEQGFYTEIAPSDIVLPIWQPPQLG